MSITSLGLFSVWLLEGLLGAGLEVSAVDTIKDRASGSIKDDGCISKERRMTLLRCCHSGLRGRPTAAGSNDKVLSNIVRDLHHVMIE